eukprot:GHVN01015708.1.p1 GENE.GHVN01015708.1~~GHVN01015708.1.p1  ORF type:complete len:160 (+),score=35.99 GHVN01015708.1:37-480(+)
MKQLNMGGEEKDQNEVSNPPTDGGKTEESFEAMFKDMPRHQMIQEAQRLQKVKIAIINKVNDLEADKREHSLVLEAFQGIPEDRRCFRIVGGVMVERTVKEVRPVIAAHEKAVGRAIEELDKQLEGRSKEHAFLAARLGPAQETQVH